MGLIPEPSPASIIHYCPKTAIPSVSAKHHSYLLIAKHHHFKETAGNLLGGSICLVAQIIKNLHATQDTQLWSLGWEDPLEKGIATHSNILAWRIRWQRSPAGYIQSMGSQSWTQLTVSLSLFTLVKGFSIVNEAEVYVYFWISRAFSVIQWTLAAWSLVSLPFLNQAFQSGSSWFTYW